MAALAVALANAVAARALFETLALGFLDADTEIAVDQVARRWVPFDAADDSSSSSSDEPPAPLVPPGPQPADQ